MFPQKNTVQNTSSEQVISDDQKHDHNFVHAVQGKVRDYLTDIGYDARVMHEWTDGCSSQYKSRHCIGDIAYAQQDHGYVQLTRNFFETSHAKGNWLSLHSCENDEFTHEWEKIYIHLLITMHLFYPTCVIYIQTLCQL